MCDRQDSFSAGHNDRQVFKFQWYIMYRRPAQIACDRHEVPTAGHRVRHWRDIYFRRCNVVFVYCVAIDLVCLKIINPQRKQV